MRYVLTALLMMVLLAGVSNSVLLYPSDGPVQDIHYSYVASVTGSAFPATTDCMRMGSKANWLACPANGSVTNSQSVVPYMGTVYVSELVCVPTGETMITWHVDSYIDISVYALKYADAGAGVFVRQKIGDAIRFNSTDLIGVSQRLTINTTVGTASSNGMLQLGVSAVNDATGAAAHGIACTLNVVK